MTPEDIRDFLTAREAVLVHFSTVMASDPSRYFPHDLNNAISLTGIPLAFSTIQKGDTFDPTDTGKGGAEGSIGILVDIAPTTQVLKVHPSDMGSSNYGGQATGAGAAPTPVTCAQSLDQRTRSNEWFVQDYKTIGIFVLPPLLARLPIPGIPGSYAEGEVELASIVNTHFPGHRVFGADANTFWEFDRSSRQWVGVGIRDIYQ
jgi:hypothetical protein